ncbi:hypothetical protein FACS189494_01530 [Spirochaetia bacterium]|nr:hypothetical protein FACS189494_01530 [Spirochaetia bacterium]
MVWADTYEWKGYIGTGWNDPENWDINGTAGTSTDSPPTASDDVTIGTVIPIPTVATVRDITFTAGTWTTLSSLSVYRNLTVSGGTVAVDINPLGDVEISGGTASVIVITGSIGGNFTISGTGQVTDAVVTAASIAVGGNGINSSGTVSLTTTTGSIIINGALDTSALTAIAYDSITVNAAITSSGTVGLTATVGDITGAGQVTATDLTVTAATGISLSGGNISGAFTATSSGGGVDFTNNQAFSTGAISATGFTVDLTATVGDISGSGAITSGAVSLTATTGSITGTGQVTATDLTVTAATGISLSGGAITGAFAAASSGGAVVFTNNQAFSTGAISATGFTVDLTATAGNITINGALDTSALTANADDSIKVNGTITSSSTVGLTATTGNITGIGKVTATDLTVTAATGISLSEGDISGAFTATSPGGGVDFTNNKAFSTGAISATGFNVDLTATVGDISGSGAITSGAVSLTATTGSITGTGQVTATDLTVTAATGISLSGGAITGAFAAASSGGAVVFTNTGAFTAGAISADRNISLTGAATLGSSSVASTNGDVTFADTLTLSAAAVIKGVTVTFVAITGDGYDLTVTGDTVFGGAATGLDDVSVIGDATVSAVITAASLAVTGTSTIGANITTTGAQEYTGAVTLSANATLATTNSNIIFSSTVNGTTANTQGITINTGTGTVTFAGAVGSSPIPLAAITITQGVVTASDDVDVGTITITSGSLTAAASGKTVTISGTITINGTYTSGAGTTKVGGDWSNNGTFTHGGGTVEFDGTSTISGTNTFNDVTVSGTATFSAANTFNDLTVNGTGTATFSAANTFNDLTVNGTGTATFSAVNTFNDVTVSGTATFSVANTFNDLTVNGDGTFGGTATVNGDLVMGGSGTIIGDTTAPAKITFIVTGSKTIPDSDKISNIEASVYWAVTPSGTTNNNTKKIFAWTLYTWDGSDNVNWNDDKNWDVGESPEPNTSAKIVIPASTLYEPAANIAIVCAELSNAGELTLGAWTVAASTSFTNTGTLKLDGLSGQVMVGGAIPYPAGGTVEYTAVAVDVFSGQYNNLIIDSVATLTDTTAITVGGTLETNGAVTAASLAVTGTSTIGVDITTTGTQTYTGAVTLSANTTLATTNSNIIFSSTVNGTTANTQGITINTGTGTVTFAGAVGSSPIPLAAITITQGVVTASDDVDVGTITITSGSLTAAASGKTVTISGTITINGTYTSGAGTTKVGGDWSNNGAFTHGGGTVEFDGTSTISGTNTFNDVTVSGTATFSAVNTFNDVTVSGTATFSAVNTFNDVTVSGTATFSVANTFNNLTVNSTGTCTGTFGGTATVNGDLVMGGLGKIIGNTTASAKITFIVTGSKTIPDSDNIINIEASVYWAVTPSGTTNHNTKKIFAWALYTWDGSDSVNWNDDGNWDVDESPEPNTSAAIVIPAGTSLEPAADVDIECASLTIDAARTLTLADKNFTVSTLSNSGTIKLEGTQTVSITTGGSGNTIHYTGGAGASDKFNGSYTHLKIDVALTDTTAITVGGTLATSGALTVVTAASLAVTGTSTIGAKVTTTGAQEYTDAVTLSADVELNGTTVTFLAAIYGNGGNDLKITGNGVLADVDDVGALEITVNATINGDITNTTSIAVAGTTALNANVETTGTQTYTGAVTLGADVELTAGSTGVIFGTGGITGGGYDLTVTGDTVFGGAVSNVAVLQVNSTSTIGADITTTGAQTYTGAVTLGDNIALDAGTNTLTFTAGIPTGAGKNLTITGTPIFSGAVTNAGVVNITGNATFAGAVTGTTSLSVSGTTAINTSTITTTGAQTYTGAVTLGANATISANAVTFGNTLDGAQTLSITGDVTFDGPVGNSTQLTSLSVTGTSAINTDTVKAATQTYTGAVTLGANVELNGTTVTFLAAIDGNGGNDLKITGNGVLADVDDVGALEITVNATINGDITNTTSIAVTGTSTIGADITTTGAQTYTGAVTLGADITLAAGTNTLTFTAGIPTGAGKNLTIIGNPIFSGAVTNAGVVNITGNATFAGAVTGTTSLSVSGTTAINTTTITTTGTQTYTDAVTLGANAVLTTTNSNIIFYYKVDGTTANTQGITINTGTGTVTFAGAVGSSSIPLAAITITQGVVTASDDVDVGTITITSGSLTAAAFGKTVTISGTITINDAYTSGAGTTKVGGDWSNNGAFTAGGGTVEFNGTSTVSGTNTFNDVTVSGMATFSAANTFNDLTVTGSGIFAAGTTQTVNNNLVITGAAIDSTPTGRFTMTVAAANVTAGGTTIISMESTNYLGLSDTTNINGGNTKKVFAHSLYTWDGFSSVNWNDDDNWDVGESPEPNTSAKIVIPASTPLEPAANIAIVCAELSNAGELTLGTWTVAASTSFTNTGTLKLDGLSGQVMVGGAIPTSAGGTVEYTAGASDVFSGQYNNLIIDVALTDTTAITVGGTLATSGALTAVTAASLAVTGTSTIGAGITTTITTTGAQTYTGAVTLSANAVLTTTSGGNIAFVSTIDGANNLTVSTGTGTVTFDGDVGNSTPLTSLSVTGTSAINTGTVKAATQTYTGAVTLGGTGGTKTLTGAVTFSGTTSTITGGTKNLTIDGTAAFGGAVSNVAVLQVKNTSTIGADITTTGAQTYTGAVILSANASIASANGDITFNSTLNGAQNLTLNAGTGGIIFSNTVGGTTALGTLTLQSGTVTNAVSGSDLSIKAAAIVLGDSGSTISVNTSSPTNQNITFQTDGLTKAAGTTNMIIDAGAGTGVFKIYPITPGYTIEYGDSDTAIPTDVFYSSDWYSITAASFTVGDTTHTGDIYVSAVAAGPSVTLTNANTSTSTSTINLEGTYAAAAANASLTLNTGTVNINTGATFINLGTDTTNSKLEVTANTIVRVNVTITAHAGITFTGNIDGGVGTETLTMIAGTSNILINGNTGATNTLGNITIQDPSIINTSAAARDVTFNGTIVSSGDVKINHTGILTLQQSVRATAGFHQNSGITTGFPAGSTVKLGDGNTTYGTPLTITTNSSTSIEINSDMTIYYDAGLYETAGGHINTKNIFAHYKDDAAAAYAWTFTAQITGGANSIVIDGNLGSPVPLGYPDIGPMGAISLNANDITTASMQTKNATQPSALNGTITITNAGVWTIKPAGTVNGNVTMLTDGAAITQSGAGAVTIANATTLAKFSTGEETPSPFYATKTGNITLQGDITLGGATRPITFSTLGIVSVRTIGTSGTPTGDVTINGASTFNMSGVIYYPWLIFNGKTNTMLDSGGNRLPNVRITHANNGAAATGVILTNDVLQDGASQLDIQRGYLNLETYNWQMGSGSIAGFQASSGILTTNTNDAKIITKNNFRIEDGVTGNIQNLSIEMNESGTSSTAPAELYITTTALSPSFSPVFKNFELVSGVGGFVEAKSDLSLSGNWTLPAATVNPSGAWPLSVGPQRFFPGNATTPYTVEFTGTATSGITISGDTWWWNLKCVDQSGAHIYFSNYPDVHHVMGQLIMKGSELNRIYLNRKDTNPYPSQQPIIEPVWTTLASPGWNGVFWVIALSTSPVASVDIAYLDVKYSYAFPSDVPTNSTIMSGWLFPNHWDVKWSNSGVFMYSFSEDIDANGKIDRIRVQAAYPMNGDFSGFPVLLSDGYEVDKTPGRPFGCTLVAGDPLMMYIYIKEKDYPDTGAAPVWWIENNNNTSLRMTNDPWDLIMIPPNPSLPNPFSILSIDTAPPRISYTLALADTSEVYIRFTEPVQADTLPSSGVFETTKNIMISGAPTPIDPSNHQYSGITKTYASQFLIPLDKPVTADDLANGITFNEDIFVNVRDIPPNPYGWPYPDGDPKYPKDYDYLERVMFNEATRTFPDDIDADTEISQPNKFRPGNKGIYDAAIKHRVSDLLIMAKPEYADDERLTLWPLYVRDLGGVEDVRYGIAQKYDGSETLRKSDLLTEGIINQDITLSLPPRMIFGMNIPDDYRSPEDISSNKKLWLPTTDRTPPLQSKLVPKMYNTSPFPHLNPSQTGNYFWKAPREYLADRSMLEFVFEISTPSYSPEYSLFGVRLTEPGLPALWWTKISPFMINVRDIIYQRSGATILNNVINPTKGEQTVLNYILTKGGPVTIQVFTLDGNIVKTLFRGSRESGEYVAVWDGKNTGGNIVARGLYFVRIVAPDIDEIRKVMIVK